MEISMISADLSWKQLGPSGASVLAAFLPKCTYVPCLYPLWILQSDIPNTLSDIRALMALDLSMNRLGGTFQYYRDDGSGFGRFTATLEGPKAIADAIKDMRAILSVNLLKNDIGVAQAEDLISILKEHPTLKSLCGNTFKHGNTKGNETELDMSGKMRGATDAMMLVPEIIDNRAMTSLSLY
jgi:hypothetical protein